MSEWRKVKIGKFLTRCKEAVEIKDDVLYKRVTIRTKHKGVKIRDEQIGHKIGTKKQWRVKDGQFILSRIDARFGAMGMIPQELKGAIVTNDFLAFDIDEKVINKHLFCQLLKSPIFLDACRKASRGITQRKRVNEEFFLNYEVLIPDPIIQEKIANKINIVEEKQKNLRTQIENQKTYLKNLRSQILQDAIKGKLTKDWREQNPDVEPASELLKKIKKEKERLIAEKKIKKEKALPPIEEKEIPFELPKNWVWTRLGGIISFIYGSSLTKDKKKPDGKYPVYGSNGITGYYNEFLTDKKSIIIGRKGSAGAINISYCPSWTTDVAYYVEEKHEIEFVFMFYFLKSLKMEELGKGIKPGLNRNEVYFLVVSLPPLEEQKAIASKLQTLMQKCDEAEKAIEDSFDTSNLLTKSILAEAFNKK